jgi:hypothetical protein
MFTVRCERDQVSLSSQGSLEIPSGERTAQATTGQQSLTQEPYAKHQGRTEASGRQGLRIVSPQGPPESWQTWRQQWMRRGSDAEDVLLLGPTRPTDGVHTGVEWGIEVPLRFDQSPALGWEESEGQSLVRM